VCQGSSWQPYPMSMHYQACYSTSQANQHGQLHMLSYSRLWHCGTVTQRSTLWQLNVLAAHNSRTFRLGSCEQSRRVRRQISKSFRGYTRSCLYRLNLILSPGNDVYSVKASWFLERSSSTAAKARKQLRLSSSKDEAYKPKQAQKGLIVSSLKGEVRTKYANVSWQPSATIVKFLAIC
jgi:hypothetical protein